MGSFGDFWGHTRTYGDVWGPMGPFSGFSPFSFFQLFHVGLIFPNPLIFLIFSLGGGINFLHTHFDTNPPPPPSIIPTSDISHILLYTLQTQHAALDTRHQTLYTILGRSAMGGGRQWSFLGMGSQGVPGPRSKLCRCVPHGHRKRVQA